MHLPLGVGVSVIAKDLNQPPPPSKAGVTVAQIFCASLGGGQNNIMHLLLSRTEILSCA